MNNPEKQATNIREHLANERTFLAWMRTSIGIMAFGFVVVKFALFVKVSFVSTCIALKVGDFQVQYMIFTKLKSSFIKRIAD